MMEKSSRMNESFSYRLTRDQYVKSVLARSRRLLHPPILRLAMIVTSAVFFAPIGYLAAAAIGSRSVPSSHIGNALIVLGVGFVALQMVYGAAVRRGLGRARYMCEERTMRIEEDGLRLTSEGSEIFLRWSELSDAQIERDVLCLQLDAVSFYPIPISAFGSEEAAQHFVELVRGRRATAESPEAQLELPIESANTQVPARAPARKLTLHGESVMQVAKDALRLTFFRPLAEGRPSGSWSSVFAAALVSMAIPIATAFGVIGMNGQWNWFALAFAVFHVPMLLGASILAAYAIGRSNEVPRMMVAGLLVSIVLTLAANLVNLGLSRFPGWTMVAIRTQWIQPLWIALALATFACRFVQPGRRRILAVAACIALVAFPLWRIPHDGSMWYERYDEDDGPGADSAYGAGAEDVFYKQPALLSQELEAMRPASSERTNVFLIGMAGYGGQNVFRREVDSVERLFRERFGAAGHTVRLINNRQTLLDVPIASATSLKASLRRVAALMDKDRDVLVLYMTSHGSEDHHFSLSLWPLDFHPIDPPALRSMLDESGIRNRVIIIAACYSGGFVKALESPDTLVITAAAADRTSFGCSNEADWTYFGKAYFDEALRHTHSFIRAFEMAKPRIEERERKEGFDPSNPQIFVGAKIAAKLGQLERQLDGVRNNGEVRFASAVTRIPDKYDEYVRIMFTAGYADELRAACEANMALSGPDAVLQKNARAWDGLEKSPSHWRKLEAAWNAYATEYCAKAYDVKLIRDVYESKVRTNVPEADIAAALAFLRSPDGARWISADREASRQEGIELARMQASLSSELYKRYLDQQGAIYADFRKGGARGAN
jgi:hypothetical protein